MAEVIPKAGEQVTLHFQDGHTDVFQIVRVTEQEVRIFKASVNEHYLLRLSMFKPAGVEWTVEIGEHSDLIKYRNVLKGLDET